MNWGIWRRGAGVAVLLTLLTGCSTKLVRAGGYEDVNLEEARLRLPAQFQKIQNAVAGERPVTEPAFLGDVAGPALDQNFWAVTHAFAFREGKNAAGEITAPALLVLSRVADGQSLSPAQLLYESAARYSPVSRWREARRLEWKQERPLPVLHYFTAELEAGKNGSTVYGMSDRENLLEAILIGENTVLTPAVARELLSDLRGNYKLLTPLENYFQRTTQMAQKMADARRKHYLDLLQTFQREELDYTPTPRVVVFNANLAGQFWWPLFDRSGVPSHFAMAAKMGAVQKREATGWQQLTAQFAGMQILGVTGDLGKPWRWAALSGGPGIGERKQALLQDTGWMGAAIGGMQQAYAMLEFPFSGPIPNLSAWLDAVEGIERRAESDGLVLPASDR